MMKVSSLVLLCFVLSGGEAAQLGPRPFWLIDHMVPGTLQDELLECANTIDVYKKSNFAIGHRGAALMFPEHTASSYKAASVMGAGIIECDVTFTKDLELVCRHSQCDLHTTTNIVTVPEMNEKCTIPFTPGMEESPNCCTSDFTLEELKTLCAKMDASGPIDSAEEYAFGGTPSWRTDLYSTTGTSVCDEILTHSESIELIRNSGDSYFTPELKSPGVEMPFTTPDGTVYTVDEYRQQIVDDYVKAKVPTDHVWLQSFVPEDVFYWIENTDFGMQAVALDGEERETEDDVKDWIDLLVDNGVSIVSPPQQHLVEPDVTSEFRMKPSFYANYANENGIGIIAWSSDRTAPGLDGYYWDTVHSLDLVEGDRMNMLYILAKEVKVLGVFSDWPATVTFIANCYNIGLRDDKDDGDDNETAVGRPEPFELEVTNLECQSIADVACDTDQPFSVLCKLLTEYNLTDALSSGKWTVFAPTDEAFANVSDILSNLDARRVEQVLLFHTVKDTIIETFSCREVITMTNGKDSRALCGDKGELFFRGADNSSDALPKLVSAVVDDSICNGVIYVMDNVMLPSNTLPDVA